MDSLVHLSQLCKHYTMGPSTIKALDDISLQFEANDFAALMGPSGSGKSTLLNIIAAIDSPTSGEVIVDGVNIGSLSESKKTSWRTRGVGYIFQFYNLLPVLTAYENIELPLLNLHMNRRERNDHVMAALEAVGLTDRSKHYPRQLSGGQQQRVAIGRAIVTDAQILLADEPTGNLDSQSEGEIMTLLKQLNEKYGKTIIMVTHDSAAASFAKRTIYLEKGKIMQAPREEIQHVV